MLIYNLGMQKVRGVNLGGWLVLEKWITPSLFTGTTAIDEHTLMQELGYETAKQLLNQHRGSFINNQDLLQVKGYGIDTVRVPVGYWLFDDQDGFIGGGSRYIDQLFSWAAELDIRVILCLHGAPGSQNGNDHSGRTGRVDWFRRAAYRHRSLDFIERLCQEYSGQKQLIAIEPLNEPLIENSSNVRKLMKYYRQAGEIINRICGDSVSVIVSDGFRASIVLPGVAELGDNFVVDSHMYQLFSDEDRNLDFAGHIKKAQSRRDELAQYSELVDKVFVGEWSVALPVTEQVSYNREQYIEYASAQLEAFESSAQSGWCYWTIKTEDKGVWSLIDNPELLSSLT